MVVQVEGDSLQLLKQLKGLRRLALHSEGLTDEQMQALPSLPSITSVQLESCKVCWHLGGLAVIRLECYGNI